MVVFLSATDHLHEHEGYLFGLVFTSNKGVYCEQHREGAAAELEGPIQVSPFGLVQLLSNAKTRCLLLFNCTAPWRTLMGHGHSQPQSQ